MPVSDMTVHLPEFMNRVGNIERRTLFILQKEIFVNIEKILL